MDIKSYLKTDTEVSIPDFKSFFKKSSDTFAESILEVLYPKRIIKRIVYQPRLGMWYPFLDIIESTPGKTQLTLMYGKVPLSLSQRKECVICGNYIDSEPKEELAVSDNSKTIGKGYKKNEGKIKNNRQIKEHGKREIKRTPYPNTPNQEKINIPIALCRECQEKVYFDYYTCLRRIVFLSNNNEHHEKRENHFQKNPHKEHRSENYEGEVLCENLLSPECGFPINSEKTNPCLKNHAIGISILNANMMKIHIAPFSSIKYKIIKDGGICGIILGCKNKILNLEILKKLFPKISRSITNIIDIDYDEYKYMKIRMPFSSFDPSERIQLAYQLFTLNFLSYYDNQNIRKIINPLIERAISPLKNLMKEMDVRFDLEILDFLELLHYFTPLERNFREELEKILTNSLGLSNETDFQEALSNIISINNLDESKKYFKKLTEILKNHIKFYDFNEPDIDLEIHEILCAFGSHLVIKSNISRKPLIIDINELIGRRVI